MCVNFNVRLHRHIFVHLCMHILACVRVYPCKFWYVSVCIYLFHVYFNVCPCEFMYFMNLLVCVLCIYVIHVCFGMCPCVSM